MDNERFYKDAEQSISIRVDITRDCINKNTNRVSYNSLSSVCRDSIYACRMAEDFSNPSWLMPIRVEIDFYMPIPKGKPLWFSKAARAGFMPNITDDCWNYYEQCILPALHQSKLIWNYQQIYSLNINSAYSIKPRIIITLTKVFQSVGELKRLARKGKGNEDEQMGTS